MSTFSKNLIQLMIKRGLSQNDIAMMLGIKQLTVSNWIYKNILPQGQRLNALAAILGVSISELFSEEPLMTEAEKILKSKREALERQLLKSTKELLDFKTGENERLKNHSPIYVGQ